MWSRGLTRMQRTIAILVVSTLGIAFAGMSSMTRAAAAPTGSSLAAVQRMGFYPGFANVARFKQWEATLGHDVPNVVQFADQNADRFTSSVWGEVVNAGGWQTLSNRVQLVESIPLGFGTNGDVRTAAGQTNARAALQATVNGTYDANYTVAANYLKSGGFGDAILRLGWEYDGTWYPWSAAADCSLYQAAYRHVHDLFEHVSTGFRYELTSTASYMSKPGGVACAWPGDQYVDIVGLDQYDKGFGTAYNTATGSWTDPIAVFQTKTLPNLRFQRDFAIAHGKAVSYPEWGLASGGDRSGEQRRRRQPDLHPRDVRLVQRATDERCRAASPTSPTSMKTKPTTATTRSPGSRTRTVASCSSSAALVWWPPRRPPRPHRRRPRHRRPPPPPRSRR